MSAHSDTAFLRMFLLVLGALVAFTVIIVIAANLIGDDIAELQADDPMRRAAVAARIEPIGKVNVAGEAPSEPAAAEAPAAAAAGAEGGGPRSGAEVYAAVCMACHSTGVAEAPKVGDKSAWAPRVEQGLAKMVETVITGKGAMPPRGGAPSTTDEEIREAVVHMLVETGLEPSEQPIAAAAPGQGTDAGPTDAAETPGDGPSPDEAAGEMAAAGQEAEAAETVEAPADGPQGGDEASAAAEQTAAAPDVPETMVAKVGEAIDEDSEVGVDLDKGQQVYQQACLACHGAGVAGAPKLGDTADWEPRIAQGSEILLTHAINGYQGEKGYMPPKGGFTSLSDSDVAAAIAYMVNESQ